MISQYCFNCEESKRIRGELIAWDHQRDSDKVLKLQAELRNTCQGCELGEVEG